MGLFILFLKWHNVIVPNKEIYENDICVFEGENYVVEFSDGAFCLISESKKMIIPMYEYREHEFEVIGNIHENPDILI